jgi:hypothetical protein
MTPQRAKELLPIFTAFAEGKKIQIRRTPSHPWGICPSPDFLSGYEYRVMPEKVTRFINVYSSGNTSLHMTRANADHFCDDTRIACIPISYAEGEGL